jgi:hypothetical protein
MLRLENYVVREETFHSESYNRKQCSRQGIDYSIVVVSKKNNKVPCFVIRWGVAV